ncbi:hypothetical protein N431DRAFT_448722 [Stipitochalara longipes BDJ]|nr:hypothetical protein N431DRAFT_448722 [Stipitochalara longipes BDJ]
MSGSDFGSPRKSFDDDKSGDRLLPDDSNDFVLSKSQRLSTCNRVLLYFGCAAVILFVAFFAMANAILLWHRNTSSSSRPSISPGSILHCGHSPQQAKALGCVFDIMDYSWTPKPCFNSTLSLRYWNDLQTLGLTFWNDSDMSQVLPLDEVFAAKHEYVFSTRLFHTKHCEYYLHRQSGVILDGLATSLMRNSTYALHCLDEILHPGDPKERLFTGFHYEKCALGLGYLEPSLRRPPPGPLKHWVANGALNPP